MSTCLYLTKALILSYFVLHAFNTFSNSKAASEQWKSDYKTFETTLQTRLGLTLPVQIQSATLSKHAFEIVHYFSMAEMALGVLGIFSGLASGLLGICFLCCEMIRKNLVGTDCRSTAELEKLALSLALFWTLMALSCCGSCKKVCKKTGRHNNEVEGSQLQANTKKRH